MSLTLHFHPFSSYCQKVLIALHETGVAFEPRIVDLGDPASAAALNALWPFGRFPVIEDDGRVVAESSVIIEHLQITRPGRLRLIPEPAAEALDVRFRDRVFDTCVMTPMQQIVFERLRPDGAKDPTGVAQAHALLETAYRYLEGEMAGRTWAAGENFTLADCAAAPALFYADWVHPLGDGHPNLAAYRARLLARPSVARCVEDARSYRNFFPGGAPERD